MSEANNEAGNTLAPWVPRPSPPPYGETKEQHRVIKTLHGTLAASHWKMRVGPGCGDHTVHGIDCIPEDRRDRRFITIRFGRQVVAHGPEGSRRGPTGHLLPVESREWPERKGRGWLEQLHADVYAALGWLGAKYPWQPPSEGQVRDLEAALKALKDASPDAIRAIQNVAVVDNEFDRRPPEPAVEDVAAARDARPRAMTENNVPFDLPVGRTLVRELLRWLMPAAEPDLAPGSGVRIVGGDVHSKGEVEAKYTAMGLRQVWLHVEPGPRGSQRFIWRASTGFSVLEVEEQRIDPIPPDEGWWVASRHALESAKSFGKKSATVDVTLTRPEPDQRGGEAMAEAVAEMDSEHLGDAFVSAGVAGRAFRTLRRLGFAHVTVECGADRMRVGGFTGTATATIVLAGLSRDGGE